MTDIITSDLIDLDIELHDKTMVLNHIIKKMNEHNRTNDKNKLLEDILLREGEGPTSMGFGVAIPHAKSDSVLKPSVIYLRLKEEIDWNEDNNIKMIFGICVPVSSSGDQHLKILANISRSLLNEDLRRELLNVKSTEKCEQILSTINDEWNALLLILEYRMEIEWMIMDEFNY